MIVYRKLGSTVTPLLHLLHDYNYLDGGQNKSDRQIFLYLGLACETILCLLGLLILEIVVIHVH